MSEYQAMEFAYWKVGRRGVTFQNSDSICFRILTVPFKLVIYNHFIILFTTHDDISGKLITTNRIDFWPSCFHEISKDVYEFGATIATHL